jgi:L-aspartate oxidase
MIGAPHTTDVLVLGTGIAGLSVARRALGAGLGVVLVTKVPFGGSATWFAQGGVAAAIGPEDDPDLHWQDTMTVAGGLADPDAVRTLVTEGPERVLELLDLGARFDRVGRSDEPALTREGGHSVARILHAGGDATGREMEHTLVMALSAAGVPVLDGWFGIDVLIENGRCVGLRMRTNEGELTEIRASHVVLASGGAGQLYAVTTNPLASTGDGLAMAWRAGAVLADTEFVQFHPTALHHESMPRPLLSEALRGEGAVLRDQNGEAFMAGVHPMADLAPRDVVARAISERLEGTELDHLWLDGTGIRDFDRRFPTIWNACHAVGLDPNKDWLPVAPAAHYTCGGVVTDLNGATSIPGFWACGEVACSGVHGANRLASNSLLEGLVFGSRVAQAIVSGVQGPEPTGPMRLVEDGGLSGVSPGDSSSPAPLGGRPTLSDDLADDAAVAAARRSLQHAMTAGAGVLRDAQSLANAQQAVAEIGDRVDARLALGGVPSVALLELANLAGYGALVVAAASARLESRGSQTRRDYPETDPALRGRFLLKRSRRDSLGASRQSASPHFVPLETPETGEPS